MKKVLVIGTGNMAFEYAKVLKELGVSFEVLGRGVTSADTFAKKTQVQPFIGGLPLFLKERDISMFSHAIIATSVESLFSTMQDLVNIKFEHILIEKPAALSINELINNKSYILEYGNNARIYVAYNRRYYSSVIEAEKIIREDGGLRSMFFEFTEWTHKIDTKNKSKELLENWFFANSTHVIDLAFYFAGYPQKLSANFVKGNLDWHNHSIYSGSGITDKGVVFSYLSDWESSGRWCVELLTSKRRILLKPLEEVSYILKGSVQDIKHPINNELDLNFKPGLYRQVSDFIENKPMRLPNIIEHLNFSETVLAHITGSC